jgi:hypothetical protein
VPFCSQCGDRLNSDDAFCGSCGAPADDGPPTERLASSREQGPPDGHPAAGPRAGRRRQPVARSSRWVWVATLAMLILVAGGIVTAYLVTKHPESPAATSLPPSPGAAASSPTPSPSATATITATPTTTATPASALSHDSPAAPFWAAYFFASYSWDSAQQQAQKARDLGFSNVLVLLTTEYANLGRPGKTIWSCGIGPLDTRDDALSTRADLRAAGWTDAYAKLAQ